MFRLLGRCSRPHCADAAPANGGLRHTAVSVNHQLLASATYHSLPYSPASSIAFASTGTESSFSPATLMRPSATI